MADKTNKSKEETEDGKADENLLNLQVDGPHKQEANSGDLKDDCSDLTGEGETGTDEQAPRSFPQVRIWVAFVTTIQECCGMWIGAVEQRGPPRRCWRL